jgi:hypothetical protein
MPLDANNYWYLSQVCERYSAANECSLARKKPGLIAAPLVLSVLALSHLLIPNTWCWLRTIIILLVIAGVAKTTSPIGFRASS